MLMEEKNEIQNAIKAIDEVKDKLTKLQMDSFAANKELGQGIVKLHDVIDQLLELIEKR